MRKPIRDTLRPLAERICAELCRWPYIAPSQDALDVICDECEVMAGLEKIMASRAGRPKTCELNAAVAPQDAAGAHEGAGVCTDIPESLNMPPGAGGRAKKPHRGPGPPPLKKQKAKQTGEPAGAAAEKRAVLERLTAYRQARGRGSLQELAKASGVRESVLWDMLDCAVVPMEDWRAVGAALDRLEVRM